MGGIRLKIPPQSSVNGSGLLEVTLKGVKIRSVPLQHDAHGHGSLSLQLQATNIAVRLIDARHTVDGTLIAPFDVKVLVEQQRYVAVIRSLMLNGVVSHTMLADECRLEVTAVVAKIALTLTSMQYAALLKGFCSFFEFF